MQKIKFRELVELFLHTSIYEIKEESETPNINFIFEDDAFILFQNIVDKPFKLKDCWTPDATKKDIDFIRNHNSDDVLSIYINDSIKFFKYLTDITNETIKLNKDYDIFSAPRYICMHILKRIWLRMGIDDVTNINNFLEKQLQFAKNRTFEDIINTKINVLNNYNVIADIYVNATYDETTRSMVFTIEGDNQTYELPHILYDIDDNNTCYIYAVQSIKSTKDKKIGRTLYKINKDIQNPNVHPSKVYSLLFFIQELKKKKISKIIIPSIQILSYRYHELLSEQAKEKLEETMIELEHYPTDNYALRNYSYAKDWYDSTYNNYDKISYLKTEELFNLVYRILEHDKDLEIVNEVNIQGDYLKIKIKK